MSTVQSIVDQLKKLIGQANRTTGKNDPDATLAIESLVSGYGNGESGGGYQPPPVGEFLTPATIGKTRCKLLEMTLLSSSVNVDDIIS